MFATVYRAYLRLRSEQPRLRVPSAPRRLELELEVLD
jgi:hypothetical protein